ncbi:Eco57I restriction-modification methylase domain-containing protein [Elizabethkingia anophelis]|uniref:Eco57I restriction-modification methylase domain-containing protein n=1 Tax=Elizabethkingia anophelis TaxID=1117645 RepID=UPI00136818FB|nr:TaqI-like C-terminal specificity domain-containing protein [Elizabethkingia anophelis]MYY26662.1 hypothetical protein [Elizabethkingia anophelis]
MDRANLHKIFEKAYNHQDWIEVLQSVFGARQLYTQPKPIILPSNERATEAFELGSFTTSDDRIIGLYRINVKSDVWLERNKVSLRELLRNVYKYDVDGAIVVFVQDEKWRLSFISEIKVLNDEGEIIKQATEPKRYTYLLGKDEKVRTPSDRLSKLAGKAISLQDMLNAFSVEALNEEFYKIVQSFFYELVGGKIGKGKKITEYGNGILQLPNIDRNVRQEFAVRLIGRTVFCWFLKKKKSDDDIALLPETLLSSHAVKHYNNYYHTILERLFFQTLNTPMEERLRNLPKGAETIPFLNGGLFEPNIEDYYKSDSQGNNQNNFGIGDDWFLRFFGELEKYNFTIDENSVTEIEVSVDPEMLGRIFENLLAEIDPDSGETARKATGSFYTPREIVDYMATESLVQYLHYQTDIVQEKIRPIFKMLETADPTFTDAEKNNILDALDQVKILDPACGSGAFPMGVLQKIVQALQKLDPEAEWWKKRQIDRIKNPTVKKLLKEKLSSSGVEYARKIGVIQNSLYGVDIQPVAAEISKLRCFLSLIVDENIDETKPNRGIEPLPNLEFKFVTADTLINLPEEKQRSMFDNFEELQQLEDLRNEYIQSSGKAKARVKEQFLKVQQKIAKDQRSLFADINSKAYKLGNWNPFNNEKSDWFDSKWMFGVEKFDVVIGNPPYINISNIKPDEYRNLLKSKFYSAKNKADTYAFFIERSFDFLKSDGLLSFIIPQTWKATDSFQNLREIIFKSHKLPKIVDLEFGVFAAIVKPMVVLILNEKPNDNYEIEVYNDSFNKKICIPISEVVSDVYFSINTNLTKQQKFLFKKIENETIRLENVVKFSRGIKTSNDGRFIFDNPNNKDCKPVYRGKNIKAYQLNWAGEYIWYRPDLMKEKVGSVPYTKDFFEVPEKIITQRVNSSMKLLCAYDDGQNYFLDTTNVSRYKDWNRKYSLKYVCSLLNSTVINFWYCNKYLMPTIGIYELHSIPIKPSSKQNIFAYIADIILKLKKLKKEINNQVSNSHIAQLFEEVINAMVMELYFKEDFEKVGIEFLKYVERDFENIEGKSEVEQIEIIHNAYQKLREKDNEIRNNLKLMDIKLADIVMPIKTVK